MQRRLHGLAFGQAGYFTAAQALEAGYSYQAQKYHADQGNWEREGRGLFRLPGWPAGREDPYIRWALWSRGHGVLSHDSALAVHELSDANPNRVHLTVPASFRATNDAVAVHHGELDEHDVESRGAWRITTVERTLADVAAGDLSQELIDAAVADALDRGLTTRRRMLRKVADSDERAALRLERALATRAAA